MPRKVIFTIFKIFFSEKIRKFKQYFVNKSYIKCTLLSNIFGNFDNARQVIYFPNPLKGHSNEKDYSLYYSLIVIV